MLLASRSRTDFSYIARLWASFTSTPRDPTVQGVLGVRIDSSMWKPELDDRCRQPLVVGHLPDSHIVFIQPPILWQSSNGCDTSRANSEFVHTRLGFASISKKREHVILTVARETMSQPRVSPSHESGTEVIGSLCHNGQTGSSTALPFLVEER